MDTTVLNVKTICKIIFNDGTEFEVPFSNDYNINLGTFATSGYVNEQLFYDNNTDIVGNVAYSVLELKGKSFDGTLISNNSSSPYFGMMNKSAKVNIKFIKDNNSEVDMGTFYVEEWLSSNSSEDNSSFTISAFSLMYMIKNIKLGTFRLLRKTKFSTFLETALTKLNNNLPNDMKVIYNSNTLRKLDKIYNKDWNIDFTLIDRLDIETIFRTLMRCTLCYIWIDRDNTLQVDSFIDDNGSEAVCDLTGSTNITSYNVNNNSIQGYNSVQVSCVDVVDTVVERITEIGRLDLAVGVNEFEFNLSNKYLHRIITIMCLCADNTDPIDIVSYSNDMNTVYLKIKSLNACQVELEVYGEILKPHFREKFEVIDPSTIQVPLSITNELLRYDNIETYADNLLNLITMSDRNVEVDGYFNPQLKLGDIVYIQGLKLNLSGYYKIKYLTFILGSSYKVNMKLVKTIDTELSTEQKLIDDNDLINLVLTGLFDSQYVADYVFYSPSSVEDNQSINDYLTPNLQLLAAFL